MEITKSLFLGITSIFLINHTNAQTFASSVLVNKSAKLLFEKTYLHTDRDVYAQGDTLWFKAYLVNGQNNKPANSSRTLYVELIASDSAKILNREIIRMEGGLGNGDLTLADSLPAGTYRLRAYTNWMRNFGDNFMFEKEITILNTQAVPVAADSKVPVNTKNNVNKTAALPAATGTATTTVRFYPEGGSLVNGISSMVAVKAEDANGKGIPLSGVVLSSTGDTTARFICDSLGMGLLALLPIAGQSYHAVAGSHSFTFPSALNKGLTLQIRQADITIHAVVSSSDTVKTACLLVVKHTGVTLLTQQLQMSKQLALKIPTGILPEGISAITLYNNEGKSECERLVYIHHPDDKNKLTITTGKKNYQPKEQATITINTEPNAHLSMAVVDAGIVPEQAGDIISYLQLKSEVKGNIEQARRYFDTTNVNRFKQLDLLLLTQGWRDFIWRRLADTAIRISYAAENGISVPGRIRDENLNKWLPGLNISLYADGAKGDKIFSTRSDSLGRFHFDGLIMYGKQNVKLSAINDKGESKGAFWIDTLLPMPVQQRSLYTVRQEKAITSTIEKRDTELKKLNLYKTSALKEVTIKAKPTTGGLSTHDKKFVRLDNGEVYLTWGPLQTFDIAPKDYWTKALTWYMIQNVKGAMMARPPSPGVTIPSMGGNPILVVNGRTFHIDYNLYYNMPIEKFKKIELQCVTERTNVKILKCFLFLTTKENALTDNPGSINAEIEGYYQARTFYTPVPNEKASVNDYRTTIHWEPNIKTDATGKATVSFYNTTPKTNIRVIVQGITDKGTPLTTMANYEVK